MRIMWMGLVALLFSVNVQAQQADKAKKLLDQVSAKVQSYKNMQVHFKFALNNPDANVKRETRGDVTLAGDKYLLNYLGSQQLYDGKKVYTIVPENEEVTIEDKSNDEDAFSPAKMMTFYQKGHRYAWDIEQNVNGRKIQFVKLTPIDSNSEIKTILLGVDVETKHIYKLIYTGNDGVKTTITVTSLKTDANLPEKLFRFDENKYTKEGYYIIRN